MNTDIIISGVLIGILISFVALGFALTFSILKFVNFAHGEMLTVGAYLTYVFSQSFHLNLLLSAIMGVVFTGLLGVMIERLAFRPLRSQRLSMFVSSFGVSLILNAIITLSFGSSSYVFTTSSATVQIGQVRLTYVELWALGAFVVSLLSLFFILRKTRYGLAARAISENPNAIALLGIPGDRLVSLTFFSSSMLAALAGVIFALMHGLTPQMGQKYGIWAFVVVVVAGFGNVSGLLASGIMTGLIITGVIYFFGSYTYVNAVLFGIMALTLLVRPNGLFGMRLRSF